MNWRSWLLAAACGLASGPASALSMEEVNNAQWSRTVSSGRGPVVLKAQILLDRAFVSPGAVDGIYGGNTRKALRVFQNVQKLSGGGAIDRATWQALTRNSSEPVLTTYTIQQDDVNGPFVKRIPNSIREKAKMDRMAYTGPAELLAEKFHMDQDLLKELNPNANFGKAGTKIVVANVRNRTPDGNVKSIVVDRKTQAVKAYDSNGGLIAFYPATVGSSRFPSPSGKMEVKGVAKSPKFTYSGDLEYAKDLKKGETLVVPPGPNNPVGIIWIDLSKDGYGIHGTPQPALISKTASHGCVRLTNWDAQELGEKVEPGVRVIFSG